MWSIRLLLLKRLIIVLNTIDGEEYKNGLMILNDDNASQIIKKITKMMN